MVLYYPIILFLSTFILIPDPLCLELVPLPNGSGISSQCPIAVRDISTRRNTSDSLPATDPRSWRTYVQ